MSTVVETAYGPVRGADDGPITSWKGVRYAAPPTGDLRWRAPQPPEKWTEVADAGALGRVCPQPVEPRIPIDLGAPQGDDCLTLNIWASSWSSAPGITSSSLSDFWICRRSAHQDAGSTATLGCAT